MPAENKTQTKIAYIENPSLRDSGGRYVTVLVSVPAVLKSWKNSLYSFEWLHPDGSFKSLDELPENERSKRRAVEQKLESNEPIEQPVLGIGIMDNVEIGIGRAEFLTLALRGIEQIPVHIPRSGESDFKRYRADID